MQPLKTYEVTLRKTRVFTRKVEVKALCIEDAQTLAKYEPSYGYAWDEDEAAETTVATDAEDISITRPLKHYTALAEEAKATIPGVAEGVIEKTIYEPAFPRSYTADGHNGLSIRDYFAAKAMQAWHANPLPEDRDIHSVADWSYRQADAILKARG